jgi:hypothetical protein
MRDVGQKLSEVLESLVRLGVPLPHEIGTFVALEACEAVARRPAALTAETIWLDDDGHVSVGADAGATEQEACRALIVVLAELLVRSAPGVPAMLLELVERGHEDASFAQLHDEIEASLVPLNRSATRRVLARLLREARREAPRFGRAHAAPDGEMLEAELSDLLGPGAPGASPEDDAPSAAEKAASQEPPPQSDTVPARKSLPSGVAASPPRAPRLDDPGLSDFEREADRRGWRGLFGMGV